MAHVEVLICVCLIFVPVVLGDNLNLNGYKIIVDDFDQLTFGRPDGLAITLSPLRFVERDQHGNDVPAGSGHVVDVADMTTKNVSIGEACSRLIPNTNTKGRFIGVDVLLEDNSQQVRLHYDIFYVTAPGAFIQNKELLRISINHIVLTLTLTSWKFCSPCAGDDGSDVTGAFVDVEYNVTLPEGCNPEEIDIQNGPREIKLGNRMILDLLNQVNTDGQWQSVPAGYPKLEAIPDENNSYKLTIRLPRFDSRVTYDPVFNLDEDDTTFTQPDDDPSRVTCSKDNAGMPPHSSRSARPRGVLYLYLVVPMLSVVQLLL